MSSFSMVLLEGGVDVEVAVDLSEMTSILDAEVPRYSCGDFGYNVRPGRATVGRHWSFEVSVFQLGQPKREFLPLGHMEVATEDKGYVSISIPPRVEQKIPGTDAADWDGKLFGAFVCQLLNSLHERHLIDLPGALPKV